jgi:hypothetical protein
VALQADRTTWPPEEGERVSEKPLLLIDVDGPLNPYAASGRTNQKNGYQRYRIDQYVVYLKKSHGQALLDLADVFDLAWCTTWEHQANTDIGPKIGLPNLPVIEFYDLLPDRPPVGGLHWKMAGIRAYADGRPFAWVDDEIGDADKLYLADMHEAPFLLQKIDPATGLADRDFEELREWFEEGMPVYE